jgi:hypothetical protein
MSESIKKYENSSDIPEFILAFPFLKVALA